MDKKLWENRAKEILKRPDTNDAGGAQSQPEKLRDSDKQNNNNIGNNNVDPDEDDTGAAAEEQLKPDQNKDENNS